ncbi:MAG: hypothetical protein ACTSW7_03590 [Candidatus Thorarchaeota archaeon]
MVHFTHQSLPNIGDEIRFSDYDLAVVKTVEILAVAGNDEPGIQQEKEAKSSGGIPSR